MASSGMPGAGTVALGGAATADADAAMVASAEPAAAAAAAAAATTTVADAAGGANAAPGAAKEASGSAKVAPDGSSGADATVEVAPGPGGAAAKPPSVSFFQLFRFCDRLDVALYVVGVIASIIQGCIFPIFTFLFAGLLNAFFDTGSLVATVNQYALYMLYIAIVVLISSALGLGCIAWASERQGARIRKEYLRALMRAEVGYHDTAHTSEATTRMTEDIGLVVRGVGEPLANAIQFGTQFVAGIALGYARGPALAAVVTAFLPLLALFAAGMKVFLGRVQKLESDAYARAGEVANEAIGNIRVVASYCGEEAEVARYSGHLGRAERMGILKGIATGTSLGGVWLSILATYAVGLWYGGVLIANSRAADATCTYNPLATGCFNGGSVSEYPCHTHHICTLTLRCAWTRWQFQHARLPPAHTRPPSYRSQCLFCHHHRCVRHRAGGAQYLLIRQRAGRRRDDICHHRPRPDHRQPERRRPRARRCARARRARV